MINLHPKLIKDKGRQYIKLPLNEFKALQEYMNDLEDLSLLRQAKQKESNKKSIPLNAAKKLIK